ncbi:MAG: hypothetical protein AUJ52_14295 [Elusimicrobia bacterium CG1_02_63_36]|nr:MAG: hypothetical protein AUJ52_14295 [Elusimicrobia bacterium CG1_02_63_36]PIR16032.1 MAG: hypothetical protein COV48_11115 [Elusimicrobia bacterium CG11_big_fil_rev_8_21_14_0_20_64_6]
MSLKEFRESLLERLITFLWRQWSALGVLGQSSAEEDWVIDPEALLVFSLELGRYEPRLFDEILAWLEVNDHWLDTARLRRIIQEKDPKTIRVVGGALRYLQERGKARKWGGVVSTCKRLAGQSQMEPLFMHPSGEFHPRAEGDKIDPSFLAFDINRSRIRIQKQGKDVPVNAHTNLRFLLRASFGGGAKSESIAYLLTHFGGRPNEIAEEVGLSRLSIHEALSDLYASKLGAKRPKGKRIEYYLSPERWWGFLNTPGSDPDKRPKWVHWIAIFRALSVLWQTVDEIAEGTLSDYMKSSKLKDSMEIVVREFSRAGQDVSSAPSAGLTPELHQRMALRFLSFLFSLKQDPPAETA